MRRTPARSAASRKVVAAASACRDTIACCSGVRRSQPLSWMMSAAWSGAHRRLFMNFADRYTCEPSA